MTECTCGGNHAETADEEIIDGRKAKREKG
jgi:hypothetical protein